jgi:putative transposase
MPRTRYRIFETEYPYFLTDTIVAWLPIFSQPWAVEIIFDSWRYLQRERCLEQFGYVVMENPLHWIARSPNLSKDVGDFKSFTA